MIGGMSKLSLREIGILSIVFRDSSPHCRESSRGAKAGFQATISRSFMKSLRFELEIVYKGGEHTYLKIKAPVMNLSKAMTFVQSKCLP